jgi:hypothetical protein
MNSVHATKKSVASGIIILVPANLICQQKAEQNPDSHV